MASTQPAFRCCRVPAPDPLAQFSEFGLNAGPPEIVIGDLNDDSKQDLVIPMPTSNSLAVLRGIGVGSFDPPSEISVGSAPISVAIGDFDNDGNQDVAVVNRDSGDVSVLPGTGTGAFEAPVYLPVSASPKFNCREGLQ